MSHATHHQSHADIRKRLRRAAGHLAGVIEMIEAGRPCVELAQQLHAVERAIGEAKRTLISDHLDHCLEAAAGTLPPPQRQAVDEMKEIARYL
jgi:uncharacterized protein